MSNRLYAGLRAPLPVRQRSTRPAVRAVAMGVFGVALTAWVVAFGVPSDTVQIFIWLWFATIAWNVGEQPRYHLGFLRDWWLPMALLVFYFYSRGVADELFAMPVHYMMPIEVDRAMFGGELPSAWLQEQLCGSPCERGSEPRWYDLVLAVVYTSHFVVGLTIAVVLWLRNRVEWKRWMRRYVAANLAALVVYVLYPMAPPWLASNEGRLESEVLRITARGWDEVGLGRFHLILTGVGNPVAAMPSLHFGISLLIAAYGIWRLRSAWKWLLAVYPAAMGLGLVYFGEHYVVDLIGGGVLVAVVMIGSFWWERSRGD